MIADEQPPGRLKSQKSGMNADDIFKVRSLYSTIPRSTWFPPPPVPLKHPSLPSRVERENIELMMDSPHLFHSAQRGLAQSLSSRLVFGLKAARKGLAVTDPLC